MDGTVESIADLDLLLSGGLTNSDGSQSNTYIEILASGDLRVKGKISEQTIQGIYQDMPVIVRFRVDPTQYWNGTISTIDTQASADSNVYYDSSDNRASKYAFYVNLESIDGLMLEPARHHRAGLRSGHGEGRHLAEQRLDRSGG